MVLSLFCITAVLWGSCIEAADIKPSTPGMTTFTWLASSDRSSFDRDRVRQESPELTSTDPSSDQGQVAPSTQTTWIWFTTAITNKTPISKGDDSKTVTSDINQLVLLFPILGVVTILLLLGLLMWLAKKAKGESSSTITSKMSIRSMSSSDTSVETSFSGHKLTFRGDIQTVIWNTGLTMPMSSNEKPCLERSQSFPVGPILYLDKKKLRSTLSFEDEVMMRVEFREGN